MPRFLSTTGKSNLAIAVCDRCHIKGAAVDMVPDGDRPGLFVHKHCSDVKDPWKLPPRQTEQISIPHPRPDTPIPTTVDTQSLLKDAEG